MLMTPALMLFCWRYTGVFLLKGQTSLIKVKASDSVAASLSYLASSIYLFPAHCIGAMNYCRLKTNFLGSEIENMKQ